MKVCIHCNNKFSSSDWTCPACTFSPSHDGVIPLFAPDMAAENDGFCADYFDELERLEAANFWFRARNNLIISTFHDYCPNTARFMEIGCGTGFVMKAIAEAFPDAKITGTEIYSKGLVHALKRVPRADLIQADARRLPYEDHYDAIGAFDVLEHIENDEQVLMQVYRALAPGGIFFVTVPQHQWLWSQQDELAHHVRRYSAHDLCAKMTSAGFSVLHTRSFVSLLLPLLWLTRSRFRTVKRSDALIELRTGFIVNKLLSFVMAIESMLYCAGVSFPVGGSLLVIARKPNL